MYHIFDEARSCMVENALTLHQTEGAQLEAAEETDGLLAATGRQPGPGLIDSLLVPHADVWRNGSNSDGGSTTGTRAFPYNR